MTDSQRALRTALLTLRDECDRDQSAVADFSAVIERGAEFDLLDDDLSRQLERAGRAAVFTLVGATGAGKSTLLNALVGDAVAQEGVDRPTTRRPVVYAPGDADITALVEDAASVEVVRRTPEAGNPWSRQVFVDAPDLNSIAQEHRAVVHALAQRSDVLLVVLHRQSILEEASVSFLDEFAGRRGLVFVLNRADELTPESRDELLGQIRKLADERWEVPEAPVVAVSAKHAQSQPNASGWDTLCEHLQRLAREGELMSVRRQNALGVVAQTGSAYAGVRHTVSEDLGGLAAAAGEGLDALAQRVGDEVEERLQLRRADLAAMLYQESAKRWDGPGGWALRAGGLSGLGLGAGALIARRNPWIALGTAAGGLAAGKVEKMAREHRVQREHGLVPEPTVFGEWHRETLANARIRATRLSESPERFALPTVDEAHAEATAAVGDAWSELVDKDLPAAAERSTLRHFRLLLDLPVYGMAGFVLYQAGAGFFAGNYVGVDLLLNAVLLLLAYLFLVRLVVRRGLSLRAGALLGKVQATAQSRLQSWREQQATHIEREVQTAEAALERLANLEARWRDRLQDS